MSKKSVFSLQFIIKFFRNFLNAKNRRSLDPINVQEICGKSNSVMTESEMIERARAICDKYNDPDEDTKKTIQNLFLKEECSYIKVIYEKVYNEL